jgi:hypothetical protein
MTRFTFCQHLRREHAARDLADRSGGNSSVTNFPETMIGRPGNLSVTGDSLYFSANLSPN